VVAGMFVEILIFVVVGVRSYEVVMATYFDLVRGDFEILTPSLQDVRFAQQTISMAL
jgi:hypothetical protein